MNSITNRLAISVFSALFLLAAVAAAYFQEVYLLLIPFGLLVCFFLVQNPVYLFYLLIASIPWSMEFSFYDTWGTDLPDEPLMLLTAFALIIWLAYHARTIVKSKTFHPLIWILAIQLLWSLITVWLSTDFLASIKYFLAKCWYLAAFVAAPLLLFRNERIFRNSMILLLVNMLIVMFITLIRHGFNGWTFLSVNPSLQPFFRNHVNYSALLVCMVPVQLAIIRISNSGKLIMLIIVTLIITLIALYFSYARGAWLALLTGLLSYWLIRKKLLFYSFLLFFSLCMVTVFWLKSEDRYLKFSNDFKTTIFHPNFSEHLLATYQMKDMSTAERFYRWIAGVRMIKDSWKTGFGPTTFYGNYKSYTVPAFKTWVSKNEEHSTVHNYFLLMIVEQGAMGLLLFLVLLGTLFWYAQSLFTSTKDKKNKVIIASVASVLMMISTIIFLSDLIETDKIGSLFYLCLSVIIFMDYKIRKENSDLSPDV